jgi:hypothetical protein
MILRKIKYFLTKNPLDLLDYDELISDRIKYNADIKYFHERITAIEKEIDIYWNKAKETKSPSDERAFAERINTLSQNRNSISSKISNTESRLRTVEEFIYKIDERKTRRSIDPLTTGSQSDLEDLLNKISDYDIKRYETDQILSTVSDPKIDNIDDNVNEVLQTIKATKTSDTYKIASEKEQVSTKSKSPEFEN